MTDIAPGLLLARLTPSRRGVVEDLAAEILAHSGRGRTTAAIDGATGVPTARFADDLAVALRDRGAAVFRASTADFSRPRPRDAAARAGEKDPLDEATLRRVLIDPFRMGGGAGFTLRAFDAAADRPFESAWTTAPPDAVLLIDGAGLQRPGLRGAWNHVTHLLVDPATPRPVRQADARAAASAVVDTTDPEAPRRVFDDRC